MSRPEASARPAGGEAGHPQDLGLRAQAAAIADGSLDPRELLAATVARLEERDGALRSTPERYADEAAAMLAAAPRGPLHGVPLTLKDMFAVPWRGAGMGARHVLVAPGESGAFRRLRDAGAVIVGLASMHELGLGTTGRVSPWGPVGNPWDPERCGGGSSGGSAAAVGARLVAGSVGSDSGGSTRLPAAWCGVTGLKVTFGAVPRDGYTSRNMTLSAPGVFGRDAGDARLLAEALLARPLPAGDGGATLRVGVVRDPYWKDVAPGVAARCREALDAAGWEVAELSLEWAGLAAAALAVRISAEALATFPTGLLDDVDPLTRATLKYSMLFPAPALVRADRVRAAIRRWLVEAFARCDVLAWPAVPAPAPRIENPTVELPSGTSLADPPNVRQAAVANLAGVPGISLPAGFADDLPVGLQLLAPWNDEATLLRAAEHLERATDRAHVDATPPIATGS
jgi:aspartyl-tRNA(Asn)/glutamyl-tRNA(Gln) amidotransferase subunit A